MAWWKQYGGSRLTVERGKTAQEELNQSHETEAVRASA